MAHKEQKHLINQHVCKCWKYVESVGNIVTAYAGDKNVNYLILPAN